MSRLNQYRRCVFGSTAVTHAGLSDSRVLLRPRAAAASRALRDPAGLLMERAADARDGAGELERLDFALETTPAPTRGATVAVVAVVSRVSAQTINICGKKHTALNGYGAHLANLSTRASCNLIDCTRGKDWGRGSAHLLSAARLLSCASEGGTGRCLEKRIANQHSTPFHRALQASPMCFSSKKRCSSTSAATADRNM